MDKYNLPSEIRVKRVQPRMKQLFYREAFRRRMTMSDLGKQLIRDFLYKLYPDQNVEG